MQRLELENHRLRVFISLQLNSDSPALAELKMSKLETYLEEKLNPK